MTRTSYNKGQKIEFKFVSFCSIYMKKKKHEIGVWLHKIFLNLAIFLLNTFKFTKLTEYLFKCHN